MKKAFLFVLFLCLNIPLVKAQKEGVYHFKEIYSVPADLVISQGKTGACWSFATTSFLESEIYRQTHQWVDLSEMFNVRMLYMVKMMNYVGRQGHAQFGPGGLSHDVIYAFKHFGAVPNEVYNGLVAGQVGYDYKGMSSELKLLADKAVEDKNTRMKIQELTSQILNNNMGGPPPKTFNWKGKTYTPLSFAASLPINPDNYVEFTSFGFHPNYIKFILNIPDNYNNGAYWNIPLDDLTEIIDRALEKGYSVALDCDVSEKTFLRKPIQIAVFPENPEADFVHHIVSEKWIKPEQRNEDFWTYHTEDDHLMHIIGLYKDQLGNQYYKVKNSWGTSYADKGYWMMSKAYIRAKAIGIMVNKEAVSSKIAKKTFGKN